MYSAIIIVSWKLLHAHVHVRDLHCVLNASVYIGIYHIYLAVIPPIQCMYNNMPLCIE